MGANATSYNGVALHQQTKVRSIKWRLYPGKLTWNLKFAKLWKGKSSELNLHFWVPVPDVNFLGRRSHVIWCLIARFRKHILPWWNDFEVEVHINHCQVPDFGRNLQIPSKFPAAFSDTYNSILPTYRGSMNITDLGGDHSPCGEGFFSFFAGEHGEREKSCYLWNVSWTSVRGCGCWF